MKKPWTVIDLFSGAGGMSFGFHAHPEFKVIGAIDAQIGKPSSHAGSLECNGSYEANIGLIPLDLDLARVSPEEVANALDLPTRDDLSVLCSCVPCTGFSRTLNKNHMSDDPRNSLVGRTAQFVRDLRPQILLMENARELIRGNFRHHLHGLEKDLRKLGYEVQSSIHFLNRFGLPQQRERALVIAAKREISIKTMDDLWSQNRIDPQATHVRRAISRLPRVSAGEVHVGDPMHASPAMGPRNLRRLQSIPRDGGSWADLRDHPEREVLLTKAMRRYADAGEFGSHPDVYGRMAWDRPAPTIKRECGHIGNGRYAHPEQDRLCTVREMGILQGFPRGYLFASKSLTNRYRHLGDAVPPLISYQLAWLCRWMLTGIRPSLEQCLLPDSHLQVDDLLPAFAPRGLFAS